MKIHVYSANRIEPWDYRNVFEIGIGGSETSHVELAIRLARRGHEVVSYTALPPDTNGAPHWRYGVYWRDIARADFSDEGLWIIYRQPSVGAQLTDGCRAWLVCQDVFYPDWKSEDVAKFEQVIALCPRHLADIASRDPVNAHRLVLSGNGVNVERIERVEQDGKCKACKSDLFNSAQPGRRYVDEQGPIFMCLNKNCEAYEREVRVTRYHRNPARLIWASSPDRGLKELLDIFERAKEQVPNLELHVFYGMDNIDKICGGDRTKYPWRESWKQYDRANAMEGVTWRGRIGQEQLAREYLASGIWCYPTWFSETSCISCMEAQALGAIPITNPIWATGYNVKHGIFIEGTPADRLVMSRYVDAVVRLAENPAAQEGIRVPMMEESRSRLSWERIADQWSEMAEVGCAVRA